MLTAPGGGGGCCVADHCGGDVEGDCEGGVKGGFEGDEYDGSIGPEGAEGVDAGDRYVGRDELMDVALYVPGCASLFPQLTQKPELSGLICEHCGQIMDMDILRSIWAKPHLEYNKKLRRISYILNGL